MGILDHLRSVAVKFITRNSSDSTAISGIQSIPDPDRRETITRVLTGFSKFAVDSAVNDSLRGGLQVYKEGMKDQEAANLNNKPRHTLMMEEMQARMEKMEEDLHIIRLDDEDSILCAKDLDPRKEESSEPAEKLETDIKKVFIRSRL